MTELKFYQCKHCGNIIAFAKASGVPVVCCGEKMEALVPNSVDAAIEKHVPNYEVKDGRIYVTVNHVMEEDHYIEWLAMESDTRFERVLLNPGDVPEAEFTYIPGAKIYSYCNKHSLWENTVD